MVRDQLPGDGDVAPGLTRSHSHDVLLPHLNLLDSLDHVERECDGAGHAACQGPAHEVDEEVVLLDAEGVQTAPLSDRRPPPQTVPGGLVEGPVEGGEGDVPQQRGGPWARAGPRPAQRP